MADNGAYCKRINIFCSWKIAVLPKVNFPWFRKYLITKSFYIIQVLKWKHWDLLMSCNKHIIECTFFWKFQNLTNLPAFCNRQARTSFWTWAGASRPRNRRPTIQPSNRHLPPNEWKNWKKKFLKLFGLDLFINLYQFIYFWNGKMLKN